MKSVKAEEFLLHCEQERSSNKRRLRVTLAGFLCACVLLLEIISADTEKF